jgi:hypothetical protein
MLYPNNQKEMNMKLGGTFSRCVLGLSFMLVGGGKLLPMNARAESQLADTSNQRLVVHFNFYRNEGPNGWGYEVDVFDDKTVSYLGKGKAKTLGLRKYRITNDQYQNLLDTFSRTRFLEMPDQGSSVAASTMALTYVNGRKSRSIQASDPATWPKELYELVWAIQETLRLDELVCPIPVLTIETGAVEACSLLNDTMKKAYSER